MSDFEGFGDDDDFGNDDDDASDDFALEALGDDNIDALEGRHEDEEEIVGIVEAEEEEELSGLGELGELQEMGEDNALESLQKEGLSLPRTHLFIHS